MRRIRPHRSSAGNDPHQAVEVGGTEPDVEWALRKTVERLNDLAAKSLVGQDARDVPLSEALPDTKP